MRIHDENMQPAYYWQDTLTGVMGLCDSMLCFYHLVQLSAEMRTHDEIMQPADYWQDAHTGVMKFARMMKSCSHTDVGKTHSQVS